MQTSLQLSGIGLRTPHEMIFLEKKPSVAWIEVHSENYFGEGGKSLHNLEKIRRDYPVSLHGVSLSLGSADALNWQHLKKLRHLSDRIQPCLISDHLSWSSINGQYLHDLLPLPYTEEALDHISIRIQQIQDYLQRQILIENISRYIEYKHSTLSECHFLREVACRSGCGILLDINNIYVNAINLNENPNDYLAMIPTELVQEIHLAGFTTMALLTDKNDEKEILIDSHNRLIVPAVWDLYRKAIQQLGPKPTIIEWDTELPALETLYLEAYRAEKIIRENNVLTKHTN